MSASRASAEALRSINRRYGMEFLTGRDELKTWKTRPTEFSLPVKHGLWDYGYITDSDNARFHTPDECPIREELD
jgi:hypothetical protein